MGFEEAWVIMAFYIDTAPKILKNGKKSTKTFNYIFTKFTELNTCEICGKTSIKRKVTIRNDCYGWNREKPYMQDSLPGMLCTGCWNKVRFMVVNKQKQLDECRKLTNKLIKLLREINNEQRNNN